MSRCCKFSRRVCVAVALSASMTLVPTVTLGQESAFSKPVVDDSVQIELVEAGAQPRRHLRFTPTKGAEQTSVMTMNMNLQMSMGDRAMPAPAMPEQQMTMKITVDDVAENGDIAYSFEYTDVDVLGEEASSPAGIALKQTLESLKGMKGKGRVSNRGITQFATFDIPENLTPAIKQTLESMKDAFNRLSSPVPAEPIGIGGKWKVTQRMNMTGIDIRQTSIHTITNLSEDGFSMSVDLLQSAPPQVVKNDSIPPGMTMKLNSLTTKGTGSSDIKTDSILPTKSTSQLESNTNMSMTAGGQQQDMTTKVEMKMDFQPAP